jgi:hypothetical protein
MHTRGVFEWAAGHVLIVDLNGPGLFGFVGCLSCCTVGWQLELLLARWHAELVFGLWIFLIFDLWTETRAEITKSR